MGRVESGDTGRTENSATEDGTGSYRSLITGLRSPLTRLFSSLLDLIFPPLCHACKAFIANGENVHLCPACRSDFATIHSPLCTVCGTPFLTQDGTDHPCGNCLSHPPPFDAARAAFLFHGTVRDLIHRYKYDRHIQLRRPLGLLLAGTLAPVVAEWEADLLLPVPLHRRRLRRRGFNQAALLVELLAKEWCLPLERHLLQRVRWTEPQVNLPAPARPANVKGAFALKEGTEVKGKRIILVDDVFTTGSTLAECARVLKRAGATAVFAVTLARAGRD